MTEFIAWPKTPRYYRDIVITEKIDGTNACVVIEEWPFLLGLQPGKADANLVAIVEGPRKMDNNNEPAFEYWVYAQSRKRFITRQADNYGFAWWVYSNADALVRDLGEGRHYGEWWGSGIQRGYGLPNGEKRFSLFNTKKWNGVEFQTPGLGVVPVLYHGVMCENELKKAVQYLADYGSIAAPEPFKPAEGVCVYHEASGQVFKVLIENDDQPKGQAA